MNSFHTLLLLSAAALITASSACNKANDNPAYGCPTNANAPDDKLITIWTKVPIPNGNVERYQVDSVYVVETGQRAIYSRILNYNGITQTYGQMPDCGAKGCAEIGLKKGYTYEFFFSAFPSRGVRWRDTLHVTCADTCQRLQFL